MKVYLAGAMTGNKIDDINKWRYYIIKKLKKYKIECLSPTRNIEKIYNPNKKIPCSSQEYEKYDKEIFYRDFYDILHSDIILINLLYAKQTSIGTVMELAIAFTLRKPIVLVMENGNIHEHPFVHETANFRVHTLTDAITKIIEIFGRGNL